MKISAREWTALLLCLVGLGLIFFTSSKPLTILAFVLIIAGGAVISTGRRES